MAQNADALPLSLSCLAKYPRCGSAAHDQTDRFLALLRSPRFEENRAFVSVCEYVKDCPRL